MTHVPMVALVTILPSVAQSGSRTNLFYEFPPNRPLSPDLKRAL